MEKHLTLNWPFVFDWEIKVNVTIGYTPVKFDKFIFTKILDENKEIIYKTLK